MKCVSLKHTDYSYVGFNHIHQNPLGAGFVREPGSWPYSSFDEYFTPAKRKYCNKELAAELPDLRMENFHNDSYEGLEEAIYKYGIPSKCNLGDSTARTYCSPLLSSREELKNIYGHSVSMQYIYTPLTPLI